HHQNITRLGHPGFFRGRLVIALSYEHVWTLRIFIWSPVSNKDPRCVERKLGRKSRCWRPIWSRQHCQSHTDCSKHGYNDRAHSETSSASIDESNGQIVPLLFRKIGRIDGQPVENRVDCRTPRLRL